MSRVRRFCALPARSAIRLYSTQNFAFAVQWMGSDCPDETNKELVCWEYGPSPLRMKIVDPQAFQKVLTLTAEQFKNTSRDAVITEPAGLSSSVYRIRIAFFAGLLIYFIVVVNLIFVLFDWNLVEPTTFFFGQFTALWAIWHHYRHFGCIPFSWTGVCHACALKLTKRV